MARTHLSGDLTFPPLAPCGWRRKRCEWLPQVFLHALMPAHIRRLGVLCRIDLCGVIISTDCVLDCTIRVLAEGSRFAPLRTQTGISATFMLLAAFSVLETFMIRFRLQLIAPLLAAFALVLLGEARAEPDAVTSTAADAGPFTVYKSPTCGCCGAWIDHVNEHGIATLVEHPKNLNAIKSQFNLTPQYQSCHTAVSPSGFVFEGHIPANIIRRFLQEKPIDAVGLTVPGMPLGSPGMEVGDRFTPYDVLLLKRDGSTEVYARIQSPADQRDEQ